MIMKVRKLIPCLVSFLNEFVWQQSSIILFMTSNHQPPNLVFPNFFHAFFSVWKRKQTSYWSSKTVFFSVLNQWTVCFLFQLLKLRNRKICGNNWGRQDWLFDVMNKVCCHINSFKKLTRHGINFLNSWSCLLGTNLMKEPIRNPAWNQFPKH